MTYLVIGKSNFTCEGSFIKVRLDNNSLLGSVRGLGLQILNVFPDCLEVAFHSFVDALKEPLIVSARLHYILLLALECLYVDQHLGTHVMDFPLLLKSLHELRQIIHRFLHFKCTCVKVFNLFKRS